AVSDVNRLALKSGSARDEPTSRLERGGEHEVSGTRRGPVVCRQAKHVAVKSEDEPGVGAAQARGVLYQRLEDRLEIDRRGAEALKDFAGGGLLLERFGQIAVARLQLLEQPHVLDGDDGLVGEG